MDIESRIKIPTSISRQIENIMEIEESYNEYIRNLVSDGFEDDFYNNQEGLKKCIIS